MSIPDCPTMTRIAFDTFVRGEPRLCQRCCDPLVAEIEVLRRMHQSLAEGPIDQQYWRVMAQNIHWKMLATLARSRIEGS